MRNKIKVYVSHSIRGIKGADATLEDMQTNNAKAIEFGKAIKDAHPSTEFYVPGEHDEFVMLAYQSKILSEQQILEVDCKIIDSCAIVLAWIPDQHISNGMYTELMHAAKANTTILVVKGVDDAMQAMGTALKTFNLRRL